MDTFGRKIVGVAQRAVAAASANVALPAGTTAVSLCADQACWVAFGGSGVTASAGGAGCIYLPQNVVREFPLPQSSAAVTHIAGIRISADGTLNIVGLA